MKTWSGKGEGANGRAGEWGPALRSVGALAVIGLIAATPGAPAEVRPDVPSTASREGGQAPVRQPITVAERIAPSSRLDSVLVAGFVATPGRAAEADGEALAHAVVRHLVEAGYPALYGGMEPCIRARQQAALRGIGTVVCGRLLMTTATHHEVEWMVVSQGSEFGPALLREESLDALAEQVGRRVLREVPRSAPPPRS